MNHPNLDICKIIGAEFPDSEFVYVKFSMVDDGNISIISKKEFASMIDWVTDNAHLKYIVAPAPTCEELGEWLFWKAPRFRIYRLNAYVYKLNIKPGMSGREDEIKEIKAANETQARAEAVKIILTTTNHSG